MLRDDIKALMAEAAALYHKKISTLKSIKENDMHGRYLLKTENLDELMDSVMESQSMLDEIDGMDFDLAQINDRLGMITGMDLHSLKKFIADSDEDEIVRYRDLKKEYFSLLKTIMEERESIYDEMVSTAAKILKDADELKNIRRIKKKKDDGKPGN